MRSRVGAPRAGPVKAGQPRAPTQPPAGTGPTTATGPSENPNSNEPPSAHVILHPNELIKIKDPFSPSEARTAIRDDRALKADLEPMFDDDEEARFRAAGALPAYWAIAGAPEKISALVPGLSGSATGSFGPPTVHAGDVSPYPVAHTVTIDPRAAGFVGPFSVQA
jgi:hypothetical protein